jgi:hypothetical protein
LIFYAKIDDHGIRWGNTGRILARWRSPVASRVALDLPCLIRMAIKMASKSAAFFLLMIICCA